MAGEESDQEAFARVAAALMSGAPVDWAAEASARPRLASRIEQLRKLEAIAAAHRTLAGSPEAPVEEDPDVLPDLEAATTTQEFPALAATRSLESDSQVSAGAGLTTFQWGPLHVLAPISHGAFGDVYRAFDPSLQRDVALKLARADPGRDPSLSSRFLDEARKLARIRHVNVLTVYGAGEHQGRPGLWTDLIQGRTLDGIVEHQGPLGAQEAAAIGMVLCQALAALHGAGLIHRDLKPSNVMREQGGRIVLLDFGCVDDLQRSTLGVAGTPLYIAPEILLQGAAAREASDIYSLGVLLFWLVSGKYPVMGATSQELCLHHERRQRLHLRDVRPDLPPGFVQIVERAFDPDPAQRFASAGEMERSLGGFSGQTHEAPRSRDPRRPQQRRRILLGATALAGVMVLAWFIFGWTPLRVDVRLYRQTNDGREVMREGSKVQPSDRVYLEIRGSRPFHAYVVNEDARGGRFALFPTAADTLVRLAARRLHRLPPTGAGAPRAWEFTSAGGRETILVLASREPLPEMQRWMGQFQPVGKPRGLGAVVEEDPFPDQTGSWVERVIRFYAAHTNSAEAPIIWKLEIESTVP